jgi:mRNA interferase MazF
MAIQQSEVVRRGEIFWVKLDPTIGTETKKTRPAIVISNDSQNRVGRRYIVAPITSVIKMVYPFEVEININGKSSKVMLDQIRTIDHRRLGEKLGQVSQEELSQVEKAIKLVLHIS